MTRALGKDSNCSIARSLDVLGDSWILLIIREAMLANSTRFQEFRAALGIAPNILAKRLALLVDEGLMERRTYQEPGVRAREEYVLTEAGRSLSVVIAALATWGRTYRPRSAGTSPRFASEDSGLVAQLAFVTEDGSQVPPSRLTARRTDDAVVDRAS
ncbi:helix-turn-helix transcriptional regulator [Saccharopolyspora sp. K220]|uniref:winged helix-turn-helix transcriptional regulator n=1 Tax=Saccharopolyspora soli TaxID=2926618 RepID=UPI001F599271|nr:helix-turn-helix domain-containing protein [Saccharopolyspora soli]MCI2418577.1 helix-turn-helix transcriptional regulator [Saccharopolyspora soli]